MTEDFSLAESTETGSLGVFHLKRMWSSAMIVQTGGQDERAGELDLDRLVTDGIGIGWQQMHRHLFHGATSFPEFEKWIVATAGEPDPEQVARINAEITGEAPPAEVRRWLENIDSSAPVLSREDLMFWEENGYVILEKAVDEELRSAAEEMVWQTVGADPEDSDSWYRRECRNIMVELIQHPSFEAIRRSPRIHKAFSQLWGIPDLWVSADRCGFHVPQRTGWEFPGPDLHWDLDLSQPLSFGTQGILYLADTPPEQGALTLVPGFHHRLAAWLESLEPGADPYGQDLHGLGSIPVGGRAGDLIIWHQSLPHGSRPNLGANPRVVQYINRYPGRRAKSRRKS